MTAVRPSAVSPLYPRPQGRQRPLRVALVGPAQVPAWLAEFQKLAGRQDWIEVVALAGREALLPRAQGVPADVRALVALERMVLGGPRGLALVAMPGEPAASDEALVERVDALNADLAILVGGAAWASGLAPRLSCASWLVDAALADPLHAGVSLLAPMIRGETATRTGLMLHLGNQSMELAASWGRTRMSAFQLQREDAFLKLPCLLLRALHRVADGRFPLESGATATLALQPQQQPVGHGAGLRALLLMLRGAPGRLMHRRRAGRAPWSVLLRLGGPAIDPDSPTIGSHVLLKAPAGWWADPCVAVADGRKFVFVEEMAEPRKRKKGTIACVELAPGGARRLGIALDEPGHLSYPQVFRWDGEWYLTVESGYDRRISLYQATDFPLGWKRVRDLVEGWTCVDPTLHHHEGRWYLFANVAESGNATCDDLFLFVADSLDAPFVPHPASPIVCDVRRARMAGRLFSHQGRLIRPAQDCAPGYGNAVVFNEILELGPTTYSERPLSRLAPFLTRKMDGCHTYNANGGIEVLDVLGRVPKGVVQLQVLDDAGQGDGRVVLGAGCGPAKVGRSASPASPDTPHAGIAPR